MAAAQNECGVAPLGGGTVVCTAAGNSYPGGITYVSPTDDLTVVLNNGVIVDTATPAVSAVSVTGGADAGVTMAGGSASSITASGAGANAVSVIAGDNAQATLTGQIQATGAGADAVVVTGGNLATVTVGANTIISAADGNGITITSANGSTLNNDGVIGINNSGFAVAAFGGPLRINNTGTLTSDIRFTSGADVVNNTGTFVVGLNPDFGAGADVFGNSGTVRFLGGATTPVSRIFTGLETFNNTGGLIDLRNGIAGDVLTLPGIFSGTGDSTVGLDANLSGAGLADRLVIGGAATGSTALVVDVSGPATLNPGVVLVEAGAGTQAGAFALDGGSRNFGLIEADLVFDPASNTFALVGAPSIAVYRAAGFGDAARNLWYKSADTWSAHMRSLRDGAWGSGAGSPGGGLWVQMHASRDNRDSVVAVNNFGLARSFDLGFQQDYFGGQAGFDFGGRAGDDGNFAFGVTGGYINSRVNFADVTDRLSFDAFNGGAYATVNSGSLFVSVLGKYDYYKANSTSQSGQYAAKLKGDAYGAQAEVGFRLGSDKFFVEPIATIAYVRTNLNDLDVQNAVIDFRNADGFRGKLGARLGASIAGSGANAVVLYAGGNYVHEFRDDDNIDFISGGQTIRIANPARGDYGEGVIGVNISATNMVSGFIEANGAKGSEFDAFGGRAGLRIRF
ncbi:MAG: autotransporter domain-containing protein [Erythrobacter sp.]|nr:autotransporter domain-containing protein [Erythrobacter sp.]MDZ4277175.1 autotransporter domain-containing protein [Erythrobacter sp.]